MGEGKRCRRIAVPVEGRVEKVPPVKTVHKTRMGSIIVPGCKEE